MRDRATELANNMCNFALEHSRESFKVYGSRQAMLSQFLPYAAIIAEMEKVSERNAENISRCESLIDRAKAFTDASLEPRNFPGGGMMTRNNIIVPDFSPKNGDRVGKNNPRKRDRQPFTETPKSGWAKEPKEYRGYAVERDAPVPWGATPPYVYIPRRSENADPHKAIRTVDTLGEKL